MAESKQKKSNCHKLRKMKKKVFKWIKNRNKKKKIEIKTKPTFQHCISFNLYLF